MRESLNAPREGLYSPAYTRTVAAISGVALLLGGCSANADHYKRNPNITCIALQTNANFRETPEVPDANERAPSSNLVATVDLTHNPNKHRGEVFLTVDKPKIAAKNNPWVGITPLEATPAFTESSDITNKSVTDNTVWIDTSTPVARVAKKEECRKHSPTFIG